jgi:formate--tetrahydrofolate ligase
MLTDVEIARGTKVAPITEIAEQLGLNPADLMLYGDNKAKVRPDVMKRTSSKPPGKLVLVSAITPTRAGEGKTTTTIGLGQALAKLGHNVCIALREPSLGPCMGVKGGATGGGYSQVVPADDINLHFTGDFHAVTTTHNLLASVLDNHLHFGNALNINPLKVLWRRVIDMNDRALRNIMVGMGGVGQGIPRETGFDITASSEIMAMLCLATDVDDLRQRLDRTLIGFTHDKKPVMAGQLNVTGTMMALLKDAIMPNLVQTLEGVPTLIHGGPFANIAHGCNSVIATKMATQLGDWAVTEAGFGFDLGGEKFFDIKCVGADIDVVAVVIVATIRALKMHGGAALDDLKKVDTKALAAGLPNLEKHIENAIALGKQPVVAINQFHHDTPEEIEIIQDFCRKKGVRVALSDHFARGGEGAIELAEAVVQAAAENTGTFKPVYDWTQPVTDKVRAVAQTIYGANEVHFEKKAKRDLKDIERLGYGNLPICIAKTQSSISDDPKLLGRPSGFDVTVRRILINSGAGFLVVLTGDIMRMPGLPRKPQAENMDLVNGVVEGIA